MNHQITKIVKKLTKSHFIRNFTIVMSGTVVAQALGFALSPVISRLYSPSDFGVFGSFNSLVGIVTAAVTLEYGQALILPKKNEDAFLLFIFSCLCTLSIATIFMVAYFIAPGYFKTLLQAPSSWVLVPVLAAILVSGFNQTFQSWCVRVKSFKHASASQVIRSLSANGLQTGFGFVKGGAPALIWSSVAADFLATVNLGHAAMRDFKGLAAGFSPRKMLVLVKEYRDFPIYSASINVINSLSMGLPIFLLTHYYGVAVAGGYAFAMRMLSVPMEFVLRALRQVLYQKAAETHNDGRKLMPLYVKITGGLFALAIIPSLAFILWSPQVFGWVFGAKWVNAGEFARALVIWMMFMFCNLPATLFARIIRVQDKMFVYNVALLVFRTAALVIGGMFLSAVWTIMTFSIVGAVMNVIFIIIIGFLLAQKEKVSGIGDLLKVVEEKP
jgi:lipopolysaccharide exporter